MNIKEELFKHLARLEQEVQEARRLISAIEPCDCVPSTALEQKDKDKILAFLLLHGEQTVDSLRTHTGIPVLRTRSALDTLVREKKATLSECIGTGGFYWYTALVPEPSVPAPCDHAPVMFGGIADAPFRNCRRCGVRLYRDGDMKEYTLTAPPAITPVEPAHLQVPEDVVKMAKAVVQLALDSEEYPEDTWHTLGLRWTLNMTTTGRVKMKGAAIHEITEQGYTELSRWKLLPIIEGEIV